MHGLFFGGVRVNFRRMMKQKYDIFLNKFM